MAMKYVKLFENWLLTEANADSFDPAKPDAWPVLQTTIGNAIEADFSERFLQSIFRRSLDDANKELLTIQGGKVSTAAIDFNLNGFFNKLTKKDTSLRDQHKDFVGWLSWKMKSRGATINDDFTISTWKKQKSIDAIKKLLTECIEMLSNLSANKKNEFFTSDEDVKKMFFKVDRIANTKAKWCIDFVKQVQTYFEESIEASNAKERRNIYFYWGSGDDKFDLFTLVCSVNLDDGGKSEDKIINFKCEELSLGQAEMMDNPDYDKADENSVQQIENEDYKKMDGAGIAAAKTEGITFGQVMTWLNKWQNNQPVSRLLSSSGKSAYDGICNMIFGKEVAEALPEFAPTNVAIGGKNLQLTNSKKGGTVVPLLALNKAYGTVGFDYNSSQITAEGKKSLGDAILWKLLLTAKSIIIVGNTDTSGTPEYNKSLSVKRAESVLDVLKADPNYKKLKVKEIQTQGNGEEKILKDDKNGKDGNAAALNRRVEIIIDGQPASDKITF